MYDAAMYCLQRGGFLTHRGRDYLNELVKGCTDVVQIGAHADLKRQLVQKRARFFAPGGIGLLGDQPLVRRVVATIDKRKLVTRVSRKAALKIRARK